MDVRALIQGQFDQAHQILAMTLADCDDATFRRRLPNANIESIATIYAHSLFAEDMMVNGMIRKQSPLYQSGAWAEKLGIKSAAPMPNIEWSTGVSAGLAQFAGYLAAVQKSTSDCIASLSDADLDREIDGPVGKQTIAAFLSGLIIQHLAAHAGEIAALKGVQGKKGLPF
jgi:hypothetical protein